MHTKTGKDKNGRFAIHYGGPGGIRWERGADAEEYFEDAPAPASKPASKVTKAAKTMTAASGVIGSVAAVAEAVGSLLQWWETRQLRLHREQREETDQRLRLVGDLLDRWVLEHSTADHIDLKLSHYLARESLGLLNHAGNSKGVIVPQSLLYEIERVRQIVSGVRTMVVRQFLALQGSGVDVVGSPVEGEPPLRINYDALAPFFRSPEDEWNLAVGTKKVKEFEGDLQSLARNPEAIIARVFEVKADQALKLSAAISPTARLLRSAVLDAAVNVAGAVATQALLTYTLPGLALSALMERWNDAEIERKDAVRELVLFASDVERANLLVRAWNILDQTVRASRGAGLLVLEEADGQPLILTINEEGTTVQVHGTVLSARLLPAVARSSSSTARILPAGTE